MSIAFDDGEPFLVGDNDPDVEFEAFETQMVSTELARRTCSSGTSTTQWEFRPNWLVEAGYVGSKGSRLLQWANLNQAIDVDTVGFLPRPGVPGGGFTGNYFDIDDDEFVNLDTPPAGCIDDDPGDCVIPGELRGPLLGLDEDEGANFLSNGGRSLYHSLQLSLQRRFNRGYMFNVNYTLSKSMDTFSDEGMFQIEHDQTPAGTELGAVRLRSAAPPDSQLGVGTAIHGQRVGRRLAALGRRHVPVRAAVHDYRRGLQRVPLRVAESTAEPRAGHDARRSDDARAPSNRAWTPT